MVNVEHGDDDAADDTTPERSSESIRLDQPVRVNVAPQPGEITVTVADLIADCPPDLDDTVANRRAYPSCKLFRVGKIRLHGGHRVEKWPLVLAGVLLAGAGAVACIAECGRREAEVATDIGVASAAAAGSLALFGFIFYELTKDDHYK